MALLASFTDCWTWRMSGLIVATSVLWLPISFTSVTRSVQDLKAMLATK